MKKSLMLAILVAGIAGFATAGVAYADDDDCSVPMANWQPREAVQKMAAGQGWTVRRIKIDDGCYEVRGFDAQGREIKAKIDPGTLAIVKLKRKDRDADRNAAPGGPAAPPNNGLFNRDSKPGIGSK